MRKLPETEKNRKQKQDPGGSLLLLFLNSGDDQETPLLVEVKYRNIKPRARAQLMLKADRSELR